MVIARVGLAALVVAPFGIRALHGRWYVLRANARTLLVYGAVAVASTQFFYFSAVAHMEVAPALLIEFTAPAAVVVWLWLRHGERPGRVTVVGAVLAALGLVLVLDLLSGADLNVPGVLWSLAAMVGCATYFVMSADEDNGLPPITLAAGGLVVGTLTLTLLGLVGLLDLATSTESVTLRGTTVAWWVPDPAARRRDRRRRVRLRDRGHQEAGLAAGVVRRAGRGAVRRDVGVGAARRAAAPGAAARWRADPGRRGRGQAGGADYRASCRLMNTSRVISRIAAAVGMASSAPTTPSREAPTRAAITVTAPGTSTDRDITRG